MARATIKTLLPIDTFFKICGIHPLHGNQVYVDDIAPVAVCDMPLVQYTWQTADRIGREEIAQAIADAEAIITEHTNFFPAPNWTYAERVKFDRVYAPELYKGQQNVRGMLNSVRTKLMHVISGGIEAKTLIDDAVAIVYSDPDGDGYSELATISVATSVTSTEEIAIYYPGESGSDEWEIRPINVSIAGGTATITCRREQLVLPELLEKLNPTGVNGLDNASFLTTVDVYRHYNDPSQQVTLMWEGDPSSCATCSGDGCTACAYATQTGCLLVRDTRLGIVVPRAATWDADNLDFDYSEYSISRAPDSALLYYRSGFKDPVLGNRINHEWERVITYLALTLLDRPLCACKPLESFVAHWKEDLSLRVGTPASSTSYNLSRRWLDNPIGTTRGAIHAWRLINRVKIDA